MEGENTCTLGTGGVGSGPRTYFISQIYFVVHAGHVSRDENLNASCAVAMRVGGGGAGERGERRGWWKTLALLSAFGVEDTSRGGSGAAYRGRLGSPRWIRGLCEHSGMAVGAGTLGWDTRMLWGLAGGWLTLRVAFALYAQENAFAASLHYTPRGATTSTSWPHAATSSSPILASMLRSSDLGTGPGPFPRC